MEFLDVLANLPLAFVLLQFFADRVLRFRELDAAGLLPFEDADDVKTGGILQFQTQPTDREREDRLIQDFDTRLPLVVQSW